MDSLPAEFREAIQKVDIQTNVQEIGKKHALHIDSMNTLYDDVNLFIYGITKPADFEGSLKNIAGITADQARLIAIDVNEQILKHIRQETQKIIEEKDKEKQEEADLERELSELKDVSIDESVETEKDPIAENTTIQTSETDVLKKAGVVITDEPIKEKEAVPEILSRNDVLSGIENPPQMNVDRLATKPTPVAMDMVSAKLNAPQITPTATTDHSLQKITTPASDPAKKIDPYREAI